MKNKFAGFLLAISLLISVKFFINHGRHAYTFYGDALGYYSYLPSAFIYHNYKAIDWLPTDKNIDQPVLDYVNVIKKEGIRSPKGYFINQYTYGVALMELPFFLMGHLQASIFTPYNNGYATIYHYWIKFGTLVYAFLGFLFTYRIIKKFVSSQLAIIGICILLIGSNLFWFTFHQAGMAHIPLFFLYSIVLFYTIKVHESASWKHFIYIALAIGLITVIRPSDFICILIPIFYQIYNYKTFKHKLNFLKQNGIKIIASIFLFLIPIIPQLLFWKKFTGQFLYNSYTTNGFNWSNPQIFKGLFSFSNGWLAYSPIFIFIAFGLFLYSKFKNIALLFILLLPLYIYIIYSWCYFNYINGFGSRPMIHLYPLLIIPVIVFIEFCLKKSIFVKCLMMAGVIICIAINLKLSWQQASGKLISEAANATFIKQTILKNNIEVQDLIALDCEVVQPQKSKIKYMQLIHKWAKTDSNKNYFTSSTDEFPGISIIDSLELPKSNKKYWIRCSGIFCCDKIASYYQNQLMVLELKGNGKTKLWKSVKINNKLGLTNGNHLNDEITFSNYYLNEWDEVEMFIPIPNDFKIGDHLSLLIWNLQKKKMLIKELKMELWQYI
jgi:hypothetical protein